MDLGRRYKRLRSKNIRKSWFVELVFVSLCFYAAFQLSDFFGFAYVGYLVFFNRKIRR